MFFLEETCIENYPRISGPEQKKNFSSFSHVHLKVRIPIIFLRRHVSVRRSWRANEQEGAGWKMRTETAWKAKYSAKKIIR